MLLLLKGHPATGKSALARRLASTLRWPVVDKDDARDCLEASLMPVPSSASANGGAAAGGATSSGGGGAPSLAPPAAAAQPTGAVVVAPRVLNDLSYDIMFRVAASQLSCGLSVIVDCPLARRELYERAAALARPSGAVVAVVECVPASEEAWREAIDTRVANAALEPAVPALIGSARHKPRSWEALQQLVRAYGGASEWTRSPAPSPPPSVPPPGAGGGEGGGAVPVPASPRTAALASASVLPHYLSVRTLRRGGANNNGGGGGASPAAAPASREAAAAAVEAATRAAADEVVAWLRKRGLCAGAAGGGNGTGGGGAGAGGAGAGEGALEAAAGAGDCDMSGGGGGGGAATEAVEIPVQGAGHMPAIAE